MSKIGKQPIAIPDNITVKIEKKTVKVSGPKGKLERKFRLETPIEIKNNQIHVTRINDSKIAKSLHGVTRTLIANMIEGVTKGFSKALELHGTGFRVALEGKKIKLTVGFSHPVYIEAPEGIEFQVEGNNIIKVSGIDKQLVGLTTAKIRDVRKPEPYKGKGIRYQGEIIKLKPGKAAKVGAAGA